MYLTRRALLGASTAIGLTFVAGCNKTSTSLSAVLDQLSINILKESPETASSLAVSEEQAGGRYIDKLSEATVDARRRYRAVLEDGLTQLRALDRAGLSAGDVVSYDVVVTSFENDVAAAQIDQGSGATAPYVVTQLSGSYTYIPDFLDSRHPITNREEADAYLARLQQFATVLDQETARIPEEAAAGFTPPDFAIDKAILQLQGFASKAPASTVLVTSINRRLGEIAGFPAADRTMLTTQAETIVRDSVLPAYQRQIAALQAIRPGAVHDAGCWRLPEGDALYLTALKANTTTSMTPDEIHQMGVDLVASINSEMDAILKGAGLTRGTIAERVRVVSERPDQLFPNTAAGREELLASLNAQVAAMTARMPEVCGTLARAPLQIRRVPEFTEAGAPGGYYQGAALDGSRPGTYYINLRPSLDEDGNPLPYLLEWPKFSLPTLTYHEGVPGHHWQIAIQQESGDIPFIRSALLGFNAYAEGWGLYSEQLADEMGVYADNPLGRLGYLQSAAFRSSRLVVDTGMHFKRWSREQAIESMLAATGDQRSSIETEIERYSVWPGQACGYMVGRQAILRMRDEAKTALGDRFDIKGFHDTILTNGSAPLSVTESLVREWSASLANT
ncbi:MAG: DUF885 family protein [Terricaulis sp.]